MYLDSLFTGDVSSVQLPGSEGSFQILNNHAPIVSTLKKGEIKLRGSFDNDSAENLNVQNNKEFQWTCALAPLEELHVAMHNSWALTIS